MLANPVTFVCHAVMCLQSEVHGPRKKITLFQLFSPFTSITFGDQTVNKKELMKLPQLANFQLQKLFCF